MVYVTADSYKSAERIGEPFDKKGKKYTKIKFKCDRCVNGIYAVGVENGSIKPHPAYNGVCLKCGGTGWLQKEVRLYTEQEYERNKAAAERAKTKREEVRKQEIEANYEKNRAKWLEKNGFSAEGDVYLIKGETYSIKDELIIMTNKEMSINLNNINESTKSQNENDNNDNNKNDEEENKKVELEEKNEIEKKSSSNVYINK